MSEFAIGLVGTGALLLLVFAGVRVFVVAALWSVFSGVWLLSDGKQVQALAALYRIRNQLTTLLVFFQCLFLLGLLLIIGGLTHALFRVK